MKGYRDNGGGARNATVYDDVFGGPPKFGATTLPPRVEDYTEIFQGFHASRGSSIPVLDLPAPAEDSEDVWFDVRSSKLDYSEVFGGFNGLDFAVSYDELFKNSKAGNVDDFSDEAWTPAQSESLSDESDPYPSLEMENKRALTANPSCLFDVRPQNEPNLEAEKDVLNRMTNVSQFLHVPGSTALENQAHPNKIENDNFFSLAFNDVCASSKDLGGVAELKKLKKSISQPLDSVCGTERYENQKDYPVGNIPLLSVSDLGLKTQPSHLPPPSRPPPGLTSKKGDFSNFDSKLKTSKSYAFERMTGDHSPPYFEGEIDSSSSAAAAMKDAVAQAQAKLRSAKELMDRKKEGLQSRSKLRMKNNVGDKKGRVNEGYEVSNVFGGERMKGSLESDNSLTRHVVREENQKMKKMNNVKGAVERENSTTEAGNSIEIKTTKEPKQYLGVDKTKGTVASREATEPFKTVVRKPVQDAEILEPNAKFTGFKKYNKPVFESFEPMEDGKIVQERDFSGLEENNERQETLDRSDREEEHLNEPTAPHKTSKPEETDKMFLVCQQHGDFRTLNDSENELFENLIEIQLKDNDMKPGEKIVTENWLKYDNGKKEVDMGPASYIWENYDVGFEEATEKEHVKGLKETEEQEENEFQQSYPPEISIMQSEEEEDHEREEGDRKDKDPFQWEEVVKGSVKASEQEECGNISETVSEQNEKILPEELTQEEDKIKVEDALEKEEKACARDDDAQTLKHAEADEKIKTIHETDFNSEENKNLQREWEREGSEKKEETVSENDDIENEGEGTKWDENESTTEENSEVASDLLFQVDDNEILQATGDLEHVDKNEATTLETPCSVKSHRDNEEAEETVEQIHEAGEESFSSFELNKNELQGVKVEVRTEDVTCTNSSNESRKKTYGVKVIGQTLMENDKRRTTTSTTTSPRLAKESVESGTKPLTDQVKSLRNTNRSMERKDEICNKAVSENRGKEERLQRVRELENERLRKVEEERERQIEREKDRMAVDRAALEARETRERSERAAVERATAEFRQRALADARERLEKACAEARERSLAEKAMEGRLRVEKATAEARERAVADKFSTYQNTGMRQNSLPSDLAGTYSGLRYSQTATQSGGEGESPQRCKARLERHQRTADRAANALAEKNMRDLIAQKEQAERNRLAEGLDAEVKRWSSGKQGNLRALLSTLQYILGSDSGWQAVPLTEVITTPAVKKAYRKATLCVHPDKLQQRGATIQQKYICEKVFDLLKEAWTKFNSEER